MNFSNHKFFLIFFWFYATTIFSQDGLVKSYYSDNTPKTEISYVAGILDGTALWYYSNGNLMISKEFSNGKLNGVVREFYENGLIKLEYSVKEGIKEGTQRIFYGNGALKEISIFEGGSEIRKENFNFDNSYKALPENYLAGNRQQEILRKKREEIICDVDICPIPIDGLKAIQENLVYPEHALLYGLEGTVTLIATIDTIGNVITTEIIQHLGLGCDEAAQAVVKKTKFIPGQNKGKVATSNVTLKIDFKIVDRSLVQVAQSHELIESVSEKKTVADIQEVESSSKKMERDSEIKLSDIKNSSSKLPVIICEEDECPIPENGLASIKTKVVVPFIAKRLKLGGTIVIQFRVDQFGFTQNTKILNGIGYGCDEAVESALMQTKFKPAKKNGKEVESKALINFPFSYLNN